MSGEARSREVTPCLYTTMLPFTNGDWLPELRKGLSLLGGGGEGTRHSRTQNLDAGLYACTLKIGGGRHRVT